eukprot:Skav227060  [mRNA]  locus=scaffold72:938318:942724:- [translate_table: standard]
MIQRELAMVYRPWSWMYRSRDREFRSPLPHRCSHGDGNGNSHRGRPKHHGDRDHDREAKEDLVLEPRWQQGCTRGREAAASAIGGSIHAIIEQPITTPIEASITQTQVNGMLGGMQQLLGQRKSFVWNFKELFRQGALYRALPTALVGSVPKAVIHYSILNFYINTFAPEGDIKKADGQTATVIGMATGASEVIFANPINFVKFRMQRPEWGYSGMLDAVQTIYRTEGVTAFWKGAGAVFVRNTICNGGMVGGYKLLAVQQKQFAEVALSSTFDIPDGPRHMVAGGIGGIVSYPFEMMRAARTHNISFMDEIVRKGPQRILAGPEAWSQLRSTKSRHRSFRADCASMFFAAVTGISELLETEIFCVDRCSGHSFSLCRDICVEVASIDAENSIIRTKQPHQISDNLGGIELRGIDKNKDTVKRTYHIQSIVDSCSLRLESWCKDTRVTLG